MNLDDLKSQMLRDETQRAPQLAMDLIGEANVARNILQDINSAFSQLDDPQFAVPYHKACPIEGTTVDDYYYHILSLGPDRHFICGIHFEGLNMKSPFVQIAHSTFDPFRHLPEICALVASEFAVFQPQRLGLFSQPNLANLTPDVTCYSAAFETLRAQPLPPYYDLVDLQHEIDFEFYPEYAALYERLRSVTPEHPSHQESRESLSKAIRDDALFSVSIDGNPAGFFAARRDSDRYLNGYYVIEEILSEEYRGRGYAPALQRHAIEKIAAMPSELFYGHIDRRNIPSWKVATAVGRQPVYTAYWHPIR